VQDAEQPTCVICAGECRGHSLGHSDQWKPEAGSRVAVMQDVERVARAICENGSDGSDWDKEPEGMRSQYRTDATAALSAMTPDTDYERGWNAAIEAAKWAVVGYIHPDHGRLPGEAFASAQIDKLKKPTGN